MTMKTILFDLDGTLTESGEGIMKSVQYALRELGRPEPDLNKLRVFIGPPLIEQFMSYAGFDLPTAHKALAYYRERYSTRGIYENRLYPGIEEMLERLSQDSFHLGVASSKPEPFVRQILEYFHISAYFDEIVGSTMDEKRTGKAAVIEEVLDRMGMLAKRRQAVMVGDREHDVLGARQEGIPCVAVAYGYGTSEELETVKPERIVSNVRELTEYLRRRSFSRQEI